MIFDWFCTLLSWLTSSEASEKKRSDRRQNTEKAPKKVSQPGCMLNTGELTMPPGFKGEISLGGQLFKFPHFKDGKISPEMWQAVAEPGKEPTAVDI